MKQRLLRYSISVIVACVILLTTTGIASASDEDLSESKDDLDVYIEQLESYLILNDDGMINLDSSYTELGIPVEVTSEVEEWIDYLNGLVQDEQAIIDSDFSVKLKGDLRPTENDNKVNVMSSCGRSGHDLYWWGYNLFFDCNETRTLYQSFQAGGGATAGLAAISRYIPIPPTQLASAITAVIGGGMIGFGNMIQAEHEGDGVRIRFTGLGYAAVPTGVFPQ